MIQTVNQTFVFEDVTGGRAKLSQQLLLVVCQLQFETLFFFQELGFASLQFGLFEVDRDGEELAFQARFCHCEVCEGN